MKIPILLTLCILFLVREFDFSNAGFDVSVAVKLRNEISLNADLHHSISGRGGQEMMNREQEGRFEEIIANYDLPLRRLAASYVRDADHQKDLVQEIRIAIWRALPKFRGESSERTFIYRIAHNRAITLMARRYPEQLEWSVAAGLQDDSPDPEQSAVSSWEKMELKARIADLPLNLRQVVTLALDGFSNSEIADVLGITEGNVAVRLSRAKKQLQKRGAEQ
jgi:RNA polymerase sigma-70 factor (ECF subfamily)